MLVGINDLENLESLTWSSSIWRSVETHALNLGTTRQLQFQQGSQKVGLQAQLPPHFLFQDSIFQKNVRRKLRRVI